MVFAALALAPLPGCGAAQHGAAEDREVAAYGIRAELPEGWSGFATRGMLSAATFPVSLGTLPAASERMKSDDVLVTIKEVTPEPGELSFFAPAAPPFTVSAHDAAPEDAEAERAVLRRAISTGDRHFVLFVLLGSPATTPDRIDEANRLLRTLAFEKTAAFRGDAAPPEFERAPGWYTGKSEPAAIRPEGQQTAAWAATVPYDEPAFTLPPGRTLETLPEDGIILLAFVRAGLPYPPTTTSAQYPERGRPYRLRDADVIRSFEGVPRRLPVYRLGARRPGRYDVEIFAFFGRREPTQAQLAAAEAQLDRLRLPEWPPWDLAPR